MQVRHPGLSYLHLVDDTPISVHIVKVNPELCRIVPVRALNSGIGRECLTSISLRYGALAAINGGYFMVGNAFDGKSQGAVKIQNRWFATPYPDCSSVAWMHDTAEVKMSRMGMLWKLTIGDVDLPVDGFNIPCHDGLAILYSSAIHRSTLSRCGTKEIAIVDSCIVDITYAGDHLLPLEGYVYSISSDNPLWHYPFTVGMPVKLSHQIALLDEHFKDRETDAETQNFWSNCDYIMSGSPLLIQDGIMTLEYSYDALKESIMFSRHPRSAIGVNEAGEWFFVVVEGRQPNKSLGMDIFELAEFMDELGCINALNLDGGASSLLLVEQNIVNTAIFNGIEGDFLEKTQRRIADAFLVLPRTSHLH
jgi:hypothetical protein